VYHLGDLAFKHHHIEAVMPFLNGRKILIGGNHDPFFKELWKGNEVEMRALAQNMGFENLHTRLTVQIEGIGDVLLSHFPYLPEDLKNEPGRARRHLQCHPTPGQEALLLHGHVHSRWIVKREQGKMMINVGVDAWGLRPVAESEVQRRFAAPLLPEEF
jgi:calcineurin-like phosphoesterase family protein